MKHLMFAVVVFLVVVGLAVFTSDKDKTKILNDFAEQDGCRNCAFKTGKNGCKVTFKIVPACRKEERKDNRSVIFVESDADNFGDEE